MWMAFASLAAKALQGGPQAAPAVSKAYGSPVTVGGLTVDKQSPISLAAAAVLGAGLIWVLFKK
jgi:hypothetical protein